ncbi:TPM domain-containing protein [Vagococcus elongatus]|uniref:TPM domain-containing protein n=1 Tax=Vagococcus elongatus TaxID=180344 RepID=A0A430ANZ6_9ENTE|nr:TPM domain-containing protein [Vagococcus elongatus]RSU09841.1 hypothetical protein CBF29_10750 [Vagococcus elongatus]
MKRLTFLLLSGVMFVLFALISPLVSANEQVVVDNSGLFSEEETLSLEQMLREFINDTNMDAVVLTTNSTDGQAIEHYAADFYDYNDYGVGEHKDGFIFIIDMGERKFDIVTTGKTKALLSDSRASSVLDAAESDMGNGDFPSALQSVVSAVRSYVDQGMPAGYAYDENVGELDKVKRISPLEALIAFIVAAASAGVAIATIASRYRLKKSSYSYPYREEGTLNLAVKKDDLFDVRITRRHIPRPSNNNKGGGGGSFTSSSGRSHGSGGGRSF